MQALRMTLGGMLLISVAANAQAPAPPPGASTTANKIILANMEDHAATIRIGEQQADIAANKAKLLTASKYPVTVQYWSGHEGVAWKSASVPQPGIYMLKLDDGQWTLVAKKAAPAKPAAPSPAAAAATTKSQGAVARQSGYPPAGGRSTGGGGGGGSGGGQGGAGVAQGLNAAYNAVAAGASLYKFARDEQDRQSVRNFVNDLKNVKPADVDKWLDGKGASAADRQSIGKQFENLDKMTDKDWKNVENMKADDWKSLQSQMGNSVKPEDFASVSKSLDADAAALDKEGAAAEKDIASDKDLADGKDGVDSKDIDVADLDKAAGATAADGDVSLSDVSLSDADVSLSDLSISDADIPADDSDTPDSDSDTTPDSDNDSDSSVPDSDDN